MRDHNLPYPEGQILWYTTEQRGPMVEEGKSKCLEHFLKNEARDCTALICHNDEVAHALMLTLEKMGLHSPEDMAVCSFDNTYYSDIGPTPITSMAHENGAIGRLAGEAMVELIQGHKVESQKVEWQLVVKKST
jgi:GntR family transcriptional regulator of arabinose operon